MSANVPSPHSPYTELRPSSPKVFGVLSIVFGSLILLTGVLGSVGLFGARTAMDYAEYGRQSGPMVDPILDFMDTVYMVYGIMSLTLVAMSGWLIGLGVGQLKYSRWAANGSVIWGIVALLVIVAIDVLAAAVIGPAYEELFSGQGMHHMFDGMSTFFSSSFILGTVLVYAPYPILLIAFFRSSKVRSAMTG